MNGIRLFAEAPKREEEEEEDGCLFSAACFPVPPAPKEALGRTGSNSARSDDTEPAQKPSSRLQQGEPPMLASLLEATHRTRRSSISVALGCVSG